MKARSGAVIACVVVLACETSARADDTTDIQSLLNEHVIVTASSTAQSASSAPALSTTITSEDIRQYGFRSIAEAIDFMSLGVMTGDSSGKPDIGSRGVMFENDGGKHFLLLINGHATNDPLYGAARFDQGVGVPIDLVDHIEVVVGPGSVLYGSNAMEGVINVITKSASDYTGAHVLADTEPGRSFRVGAGTGFTFKLLGAPSELTGGVEYYDRYGPSLSFPQQKFDFPPPAAPYHFGTGPTDVWGGTVDQANFVQAPSGQVRLRSGDFEVNLYANAYRSGIPYSTNSLNVEFNDGQSSELDRALRLDIRHEATISTLAQLTSRVYADSYDYQRRVDADGYLSCLDGNVMFCQLYDAGVARWAGIEERMTLNWLHDQSLVSTLGVDGRERWIGAKEDKVDLGTGLLLGPSSRVDASGAIISPYVQQAYNPATWLDMNGGARLDIDSRFSPVLSPRGAIAVRPLRDTTLKVIYSQAFRTPTWSETSFANYEVAPSPDVQPETVRSVEASIEQRFGTQRLLFGVFRTWWSNLIESGPIAAAELRRLQAAGLEPVVVQAINQSTNVASVDNYGWNGAWEGSGLEHRLRYGTNVTGAFTRLDQGGVSAPPVAAPQIFGNAHVSYSFGRHLPTAALAVYGMGARPADRTAPSGALLPAATPLADLRAALTGRLPLRGLGYSLTADYLTASHGPYTAGPTFGPATPLLFGSAVAFPSPGFAPIDQFRVMVGLRLDLWAGHSGEAGETQ